MRIGCSSLFACLLGIVGSPQLDAQSYRVKPNPALRSGRVPSQTTDRETNRTNRPDVARTTVQVELYTEGFGVGLAAHRWQRFFADEGVSARIRSGRGGDKPAIREETFGRTRQVTVVGKLDRNGRIVLEKRAFEPSETRALGKWLGELKTYGAQGAPEGKSLWGLDEQQFASLYEALSASFDEDFTGLKLEEAVARLDLPSRYPVRYAEHARQRWDEGQASTRRVQLELNGFAKGTALALLLNDFSLGFHPVRTPAGTIELVVEPLERIEVAWPRGWDRKQSPVETAPALFRRVPVELNDANVADVLEAVSAQTRVPLIVDRPKLDAKRIDLESLRVSLRPREMFWRDVVRAATTRHFLDSELKIDERGQPFLWITTLEPKRPSR